MAEEEARTVAYELKIHTQQDTIASLEDTKSKLLTTIKELEDKLEQQKADQADIYYYLNKKCDESYEIIASLEEQLSNEQADRETTEKGYEIRMDEMRVQNNNIETKLNSKIIELETKLENLNLYGQTKDEMERNMSALMNTLDEERKQFTLNAESMENKFLVEREKLRKQYEIKYETLKKELEASVDMKVSKKTQRTQIMNVMIRKELDTQSKHADRLLEINDSIVEREKSLKIELDLSNSLLEEMTKKLHKQERWNKKLIEELEILRMTLEQKDYDSQCILGSKTEEIDKLMKRQNQLKRQFDKQSSRWDELWEFLSDSFHRIKMTTNNPGNGGGNISSNSSTGSNSNGSGNNNNYSLGSPKMMRNRGIRGSATMLNIVPLLSTEQKEEMLIELLQQLTMKYPHIVQQFLPVGNQLGSHSSASSLNSSSVLPPPSTVLFGPKLVTSPKEHRRTTKPPILMQAMQDIFPPGSHESVMASMNSMSQSMESYNPLAASANIRAALQLNTNHHQEYYSANASGNHDPWGVATPSGQQSIATIEPWQQPLRPHPPTSITDEDDGASGNSSWMRNTNAPKHYHPQQSSTDSVYSTQSLSTHQTNSTVPMNHMIIQKPTPTTMVQRIPLTKKQPQQQSSKGGSSGLKKGFADDEPEEVHEDDSLLYYHGQGGSNMTSAMVDDEEEEGEGEGEFHEKDGGGMNDDFEETSSINFPSQSSVNNDDDQQSTQSSLHPTISATTGAPIPQKPQPPTILPSTKSYLLQHGTNNDVLKASTTTNSSSSNKSPSLTTSVNAKLPKKLKLRLKNHEAITKFYKVPQSPRDNTDSSSSTTATTLAYKKALNQIMNPNPTRVKYYIDHHQGGERSSASVVSQDSISLGSDSFHSSHPMQQQQQQPLRSISPVNNNHRSSGGHFLNGNSRGSSRENAKILQEHPDFVEMSIAGRTMKASSNTSPGKALHSMTLPKI